VSAYLYLPWSATRASSLDRRRTIACACRQVEQALLQSTFGACRNSVHDAGMTGRWPARKRMGRNGQDARRGARDAGLPADITRSVKRRASVALPTNNVAFPLCCFDPRARRHLPSRCRRNVAVEVGGSREERGREATHTRPGHGDHATSTPRDERQGCWERSHHDSRATHRRRTGRTAHRTVMRGAGGEFRNRSCWAWSN